MNRSLGLLALAGIGAALYFATSAEAQAPTPIPSVWLQNSSPGTMQTGNVNVSGMGLFGNDVGVGTTSPGRQFHVFDSGFASALFENSSASGSAIELRSIASNANWEYAVTGTSGIFGLPNGSAYFRKQGNSDYAISMTPANHVNFSGTVGIGVTNLVRPLYVLGSGIYAAAFATTNTLASAVEFVNAASGATWEYHRYWHHGRVWFAKWLCVLS